MNLKERAEIALEEFIEATLKENGVKPEDAKFEASYIATKTVNLFNVQPKKENQNPYT